MTRGDLVAEPYPAACPFCEIGALKTDTPLLADYGDVVIFEPLGPVTEGHALVVPRIHVANALERPELTGRVFEAAALYVRNRQLAPVNFITSVGSAATQTVFHLHVHVVPRRVGDGLTLPWTGQPRTSLEKVEQVFADAGLTEKERL